MAGLSKQAISEIEENKQPQRINNYGDDDLTTAEKRINWKSYEYPALELCESDMSPIHYKELFERVVDITEVHSPNTRLVENFRNSLGLFNKTGLFYLHKGTGYVCPKHWHENYLPICKKKPVHTKMEADDLKEAYCRGIDKLFGPNPPVNHYNDNLWMRILKLGKGLTAEAILGNWLQKKFDDHFKWGDSYTSVDKATPDDFSIADVHIDTKSAGWRGDGYYMFIPCSHWKWGKSNGVDFYTGVTIRPSFNVYLCGYIKHADVPKLAVKKRINGKDTYLVPYKSISEMRKLVVYLWHKVLNLEPLSVI